VKRLTLAVLCMLVAAPAGAGNVVVPIIPRDANTAPPRETGPLMLEVPDERISPSHDVPLYVPLTDEQQELPINEPDPGEDYYSGIEKPATAPAVKQITEQVPIGVPGLDPGQ
jgi:hypothetical protein